MIQPDRVGDDLRRKTEASAGILVSAHGTTLSQDQPCRQADDTVLIYITIVMSANISDELARWHASGNSRSP